MTATTPGSGETPVDRTGFLRGARKLFSSLTFYERFEHAIVLVLTALIVIIVTSATWHLARAVLALVLTDGVNPANHTVFQVVFGRSSPFSSRSSSSTRCWSCSHARRAWSEFARSC